LLFGKLRKLIKQRIYIAVKIASVEWKETYTDQETKEDSNFFLGLIPDVLTRFSSFWSREIQFYCVALKK
jgi:hypothetical protein